MSQEFFPMPGLKQQIRRFDVLLEKDRERTLKDKSLGSHILIRGPRGVGKSFFVEHFKKHTSTKNIEEINAATFPKNLAASELFGHLKGAFTDAYQNTEGFIKENDAEEKVLVLHEFNSLAREDQAKLLVFLETGIFFPVGGRIGRKSNTRIIATANLESTGQDNRQDVIDRFGIVIDVPPLYERRLDIFYYLAHKHPDLSYDLNLLFYLYSYNWPGNFRELERWAFEHSAGLTSVYDEFRSNFYKVISKIFGAIGKEISAVSEDCFGGIFPERRFGPQTQVKLEQQPTTDKIFVRCSERPKVNYSVIETLFKIIYGESVTQTEEVIHKTQPFGEEAYGLAKSLKMSYSKEFVQLAFPMHTFVQNTLFSLLTAIIQIWESETGSIGISTELNNEKIAEYFMKNHKEFMPMLQTIINKKNLRDGQGGQRLLSEIVNVPPNTITNWKKRGLLFL